MTSSLISERCSNKRLLNRLYLRLFAERNNLGYYDLSFCSQREGRAIVTSIKHSCGFNIYHSPVICPRVSPILLTVIIS